jgi:hypothetical protein
LREVISKTHNIEAFAAAAARSRPDHLVAFLEFAEINFPETRKAFCKALIEPGNREILAASVVRTQLENLAFFLEFAATKLPTIHEAVRKDLAESANFEALAAAAVRTPLEHLGAFLRYCQGNLPSLSAALHGALGRPQNLKAIKESFLQTQLDHLTSFLRYAQEHLPAVYSTLAEALAEPCNSELLGVTVMRSSLPAVAAFSQLDSARAVVASLERPAWDARWAREDRLQVGALPAAFVGLARLGRPELGEALVLRALDLAHLPDWRRPDASLAALAAVTSGAVRLAPERVDPLLAAVATRGWLAQSYSLLPLRFLSGALFSLWYALDPAKLARFRTAKLHQELKRRLYSTPCRNGAETAESLSLIGVCSLFGLRLPPLALAWITEGHIVEALDTRQPTAARPGLHATQTQLWLGLREILRARQCAFQITESRGETCYGLWIRARPESTKIARLNEWMIRWLDACAAAGWTLLPDQTPLS